MFNKLNNKKEALLAKKIEINEIKHYKILMLIIDEIKEESYLYSKKQQLQIINDCFKTKKSIKYSTYIQFYKTYVNDTSNNINQSDSSTQSENVFCKSNEDKKEENKKIKKPAKDPFAKLKKLNEDD